MRYTQRLKSSLTKILFPLSLVAATVSATAYATPAEAAKADAETADMVTVQVTRGLSVSRYTSTSLSNGEADRIFRDGTNVLRTNNGGGDVACDISLVRSGSVRSITTGDGSIDSSSEFNTLLNAPGFVKVVNRINWCGRFSPNIIGCAPVPGNGMAVVRFTSSLEGILWAHEYGHTRGLGHVSSTNFIMNGSIGSNRLRVSSSECSAFRR